MEVPQFVAANSQPQVIALSNQTTLLENRGRVSSCSEMVNMTLPGQLPITNNRQVRHRTSSLNYNSKNPWQESIYSLNLAWPSWWTFCAVCFLATRPNVSCLTKSMRVLKLRFKSMVAGAQFAVAFGVLRYDSRKLDNRCSSVLPSSPAFMACLKV